MPARFRIPAPDVMAPRRAPSATHATSSGRISIWSITKDTRFAGNHTAQIRFEILNLTNTAKFNGSSAGNSVDLSSFGRITSQRGFMRIWQLSFRYLF